MKLTIIKKLAAVGGAFALALSILASPVATMPVQAAANPGDSTVAPCSDVIQWRYKFEDHKIYKRLYNYGTNEWLGEWIFLGYY